MNVQIYKVISINSDIVEFEKVNKFSDLKVEDIFTYDMKIFFKITMIDDKNKICNRGRISYISFE